MAKNTPATITTKSGAVITESWCRKCAKMRPASDFYESTDCGFIDTLRIMSVCKTCIQKLYDEIYEKTQNLEKTIHKLCISLNVRFSNEAIIATKNHIESFLNNGKIVTSIFGIYKQKLISTQKTMDKNTNEDWSYEDVTTIYVEKTKEIKEIPIPQDLVDFWGKDFSRDDIEYLERNYANFKNTHKADTYAEIILLKEVCYTILHIQKLRANNDDTENAVKQLQLLMKSLAISPNAISTNTNSKTGETFGLWIRDIEENEPAQWLKTDPLGDIYRDVANTEEYFKNFVTRPLKNFIMGSKDFNIDDEEILDDEIDLAFGKTPEEQDGE